MRILNLYFFVLSLILLVHSTSWAESDPSLPILNNKKVLLLNSYHHGYLWTDEVTRGIRETLSPAGIDLHIEYMDTKRQYRYKLLYLLSEGLKIKQEKHQYDLVITSDDNAFNFIQIWREHIFDGVPVVFCGVNYLKPETIKDLDGYTGINEEMDIKGNIDLIKRLHPELKKIIVITDDTTTGKQNQKEAYRVAALPENNSIDIELVYDISINNLIDLVQNLKKDTIVLFTIFIRDKHDLFLEYEPTLARVADASPVPLYATQNFTIGLNVVGGFLTNGYDQGVSAAKQAVQILSGQPVAMIPVRWETPTHPRFDFRQIQRHGINIKNLPPQSQILFKPVTFYDENKLLIEITGLVFAMLIIAIVGVSYGFLKSKRAEKEVSEKEKFYRNLFENAPSGMYEMDLKTMKFIYANKQLCNLLGYEKDEFSDLELLDLITEESKPLYNERIKKLIAGETDIPRSVEYQMLRKDGQKKWVVLNIDFIQENDKAARARVVIHDITERKQLEEFMVQSEKMLSIGGLAAGMAHEINNPLAGMMQNAQVVYNRLSQSLPANLKAAEEIGITIDEIKTYMEKRNILRQLESINTAGTRAAQIVNNMLSFARKSDSTRQWYHPEGLIDEALSLAQSDYNLTKKYDFRQIKISKEYEPDLPEFPCEKSKIEQVLLNIFKNSSEAMASEENRTLTSELKLRLFQEKEHICIEIEDNGPGMEDHTRKRVFEPFFTTKSVDEGTGLGLSVSYFIIVDDHKGQMDVTSTPGQGTCFTIRLPKQNPLPEFK